MATKRRGWLTREDWIAATLETLATEGIGNVRVERVARKLGVTKGSFYGHFKNRQDLLSGVLELWEQRSTGAVAELLGRSDAEAVQRLLAAMEHVIFKGRGKHDAAVRAWAMHDKAAAMAVARVDRRRHSLGAALFEEMGFRHVEAGRRARIANYYLLGEAVTPRKGNRQERGKLVRHLHRMLTEPLAAAAAM